MYFFNGDWGLGIGDWGLGSWGLGPYPIPQSPSPNPQPPPPNPQSPIPNPHLILVLVLFSHKYLNNKKIKKIKMNYEKKYFLFPKPRLNHLLFLFYFISSLVKEFILIPMKKYDNLSIPIFKLYVYEIGDFLSIIPYLILKKKTKSKNIEKSIDSNNNEEKNDLIYNDTKTDIFSRMKKPIIKNIFIISLVNFIALISTIIFYLIKKDQRLVVKHANLNIVYIFNILFLFVLSKFILKISFYSHHYFSFIIFIICLVVITIIDFIEIKKKGENIFNDSVLYIVIRIFGVLLYSIENILAKIMFLKYYYSPYLLLLMKAFIKLFF